VSADQKWLNPVRKFGQPTSSTHPHILKDNEIIKGITLDEIIERRARLVETIKQYSSVNHTSSTNHCVVIPSATKKYMSGMIPYVFRQNSDFLYLTGCLEQDSVLVIEINEESSKSILFLRAKDRNTELWDGAVTGPDGASDLFSVDDAYSIKDLDDYIQKQPNTTLFWYDDKSSDQKNITTSVKATKCQIDNPLKLIHTLRYIKSNAEIELMRKTCEIASEAINHTMSTSKPGISEHQIFAEVDYQCRSRGASWLGYPPVVAAGVNATTIHYINNTQIVKNGELVLMDAGCEYGGYSSDITRTWPIDGNFTEPQRVLYEVVLNLQEDLLKTLLNPGGTSLDELFDTMCLKLGKYLQEVGLISREKSGYDLARAAYKFCPHHVSHYLGMDIHDTPLVSRSNPLMVGNVFTVEPGIYIGANRNDVPEEFRGLGVRIEDDVFINQDMKLEILTSKCVKDTNELLKLVKNNKV
jgi:Xaa-Pro aminopeptidase